MRRVFIAALASLLLWSQAAECRAQSPSRAPKQDADALATALRIAGGLESGSDKDSALFSLSQSYAKVGRFDEAERCLFDGRRRDEGRVARPARGRVEAGKLDRVVGLLEESLQTIRRVGKDEFNSSSAYVLTTLVGGEERWDSDALTLNRVTVKSVLARLVEAGRADEAAKILALEVCRARLRDGRRGAGEAVRGCVAPVRALGRRRGRRGSARGRVGRGGPNRGRRGQGARAVRVGRRLLRRGRPRARRIDSRRGDADCLAGRR